MAAVRCLFRLAIIGALQMQKTEHPWYRLRRYLHFDLPVKQLAAEDLIKSPNAVIKHSFYPFITYQIVSRKCRPDENGKPVKVTKPRNIAYSSHIDSHIYAYYCLLLNDKYEALIKTQKVDTSVLAFRKLGLCNIDFAKNAFDEVVRMGNCSVIALDIEKFFDTIDHDVLKKAWCKTMSVEKLPLDHYKVYRSLTSHSSVDRYKLYDAFNISKTNPRKNRNRICEPHEFRESVREKGLIIVNRSKKGIPQGSPISALLSNIYMFSFDLKVKTWIEEKGGTYLRYCDDMLCIIPQEYQDETERFLSEEIQSLKLSINTEKTKKHKFSVSNGQFNCDKPIQYLGFTFDGQRKLIRSAALARYSERMKSAVRIAKLTRIKENRKRISKGQKPHDLYKKKLYDRFSHLGTKRSFVRYGFRSAEIMGSTSIKRQLKPLWKRLNERINRP